MAPKRRGARAAPTAKRGRAGDSQRLEADAGAVSEPPLAVANNNRRLVHFHREDGKVFVELTSMWRWLSGTLKATQGDERLAKTLRRRGYNGARFTAPMDGPGDVKHVELRIANTPKTYPVADDEALKDLLQELDQEVIDANHDLIGKVLQRMGSEPERLVTHYPQVAFVENGDKLAVVKRYGCKPRLALFALLKLFAPRYDPWDLFHRKGLKEFLAACGVRGTSWGTQAQDGVLHEVDRVLHEVVGEGPRHIIFDSETISQHEKAAGAKSEGLTFGPCCDYHGSKPVLLCDLEVVFLVLMRLRTSEVRELQAIMSHQGLVIMGGNAAVATAMADHWKAEREAKPSNVILQFLGAAVDHEAAQASGADEAGNALAINDNVAQESIVRTLVPALERALDQAVSVRFDEVARALGARLDAAVRELARPQVNINTSARRSEDLRNINVEAPQNAQEEARLRSATTPTNKFLRGRWKREWSRRGLKYTSVTLHFSILLQAGCR